MSLSDRALRWERAFRAVWQDVVGSAPSQKALHMALAVAMYETRLGAGWVNAEIHKVLVERNWTTDSFEDWAEAIRAATNLGATQYKRPQDFGPGPWPSRSPDGKGFLYYDSSPTSSGESVKYPMYFTALVGGSDEEVAAHYLRILFTIHGRHAVLQAAERGDVMGVSETLFASRYYESFGATREQRIANHYRALSSATVSIAKALAWPMPDGSPLPRGTVRKGDQGQDVIEVQSRLGIKPDGFFGPVTEQAVKAFQKAHGLTPDGIVGGLTWTALTASEAQPEPEPDGGTIPSPPPDTKDEARDLLLKAKTGIEAAIELLG